MFGLGTQFVADADNQAMRGPKHVVKAGKTPVLSAKETRTLLDGIDVTTLVGLRARAALGHAR